MISLTEAAANKLKNLFSSNPSTGVRVGVRGGGCSGFTYKLEFGNQASDDRVISDKGVEMYIDPKSYLYLMGTEIDFIDELNQAGFKFTNPTAKRTCGCGESFSV
tara:strand:+ start:54 stop:368 length:315 start_codon:yes stop_codon:yes gene_type:complete